MLIQFKFRNFRSFRDETILDFSATKISEHSDRVITIGKEKLLQTAAIYGANASGKSNIIEAIRYMVTYVIFSFQYGNTNDSKSKLDNRPQFTPFLFDVSKEEPSSFEVYFTIGKDEKCKTYYYGFVLDVNGIVEEWLSSKAKTAKIYKEIFYRHKSGKLSLNGLSPIKRELIKISLNKETLLVSLGAKLKINILENIYNWFLSVNIANFGNPLENVLLSSILPIDFEDKEVQQKVVKYLSSFDASIVDFKVKKIKTDRGDNINVETIHKTIDGEFSSIPLNEESAGTLKMFALYQFLYDTLDSGGVLCIDELNARLHPLLVRWFLTIFLDPEKNPHNAQLIFTTHDIFQINNKQLRRDEIWFTEKDNNGISSLYSLVDFVNRDGSKIRNDENYQKNYLLGEYGAIPDLKALNR